jgi:hypothetical protein
MQTVFDLEMIQDDLMANALALLMCSEMKLLGRVTIEAMLNFVCFRI